MKKYKTYQDLKMHVHPGGLGWQAVERFPNGYGVSVVRFKLADALGEAMKGLKEPAYGSYTSDETEWEVAVLRFTGPGPRDYTLDYDTPVTGDVLGHLKARDVTRVMKQVQDLPKC